jgi:hypothetical protein
LPNIVDAIRLQEGLPSESPINTRDNDVLTWSTPPKVAEKPIVARKPATSSALPVYAPPTFTPISPPKPVK